MYTIYILYERRKYICNLRGTFVSLSIQKYKKLRGAAIGLRARHTPPSPEVSAVVRTCHFIVPILVKVFKSTFIAGPVIRPREKANAKKKKTKNKQTNKQKKKKKYPEREIYRLIYFPPPAPRSLQRSVFCETSRRNARYRSYNYL